MSQSRPSKPNVRSRKDRGASPAGASRAGDTGPRRSVVRTVVAGLLVLAGLAWLVVYHTVGDAGEGTLPWMADLGRWNHLIGFGAILLGLAVAAHPSTPLGRGRGVVVGMLGCFLIGLVWIVVYYMAGTAQIPLITALGQYNLLVGIGFMAVGFVYATKWE